MAEFVVVLFIVLAIVTVIGHGIWVGLARLFGKPLTPPPTITYRGARRACPRCLVPIEPENQSCTVCGWPSEPADPEAALAALRRQLGCFEELDVINPDVQAQLLATIDKEQGRLAEVMRHVLPVAATPEVESPEPPVLPAADVPTKVPLVVDPKVASVPPAPMAERVRRYTAHREAAAVEPVAEPGPPPVPRREAMSRLFAVFMEEKNIRWGELVGGLLIVFSSVALVISFWSEIAERPLLKFVLFNGVTAALFAVGFYTDRRWKIHTTSHGLLVIATLLVPLNFLAIAAITQGAPPTDLLSLGGEGLSILVFLLLVYFASRIVTPEATWWLTAGVMIPSVMQLVVRRFAEPESSLALLYLLAGVPIASYLAGSTFVTRRQLLAATPSESTAIRLLLFLGVVSAATLLPLALLFYRVGLIEETLHRLSPLWVLCGVPGLLAGLYFWRRVADRRFTGIQTAGLSVGTFGALVMLAAILLAWPDPATLLPVAVTIAVVFSAVALWFGIPAAHVPAGLAAASAWLVGFHLVRGVVTWDLGDYQPMSSALVSVASGHALVPIAGLFGLVAWLLVRSGRRDDGLSYGLVAAVTAAVSLVLVMWFGFSQVGDPQGATWTLAIYAIAALATAALIDRPIVAWTGVGLLLFALIQAVVYRYDETWNLDRPWVVALLAHATLAIVGCLIAGRWKRNEHAQLRDVLQLAALAMSVVAAGWLIAWAHVTTYVIMAQCLVWLTIIWATLAYLANSQVLMTTCQLAGALTIFCAVAAAVETREWYVASARPWLDPWFLQAQGVALAIYCLATNGAHWALARLGTADDEQSVESGGTTWHGQLQRLLNPQWATVDQVLAMALLVLLVLVAVYAALPGVAQELAPINAANGALAGQRVVQDIETYQWAGIPHGHAAGRGGWLLLLAVGAMLAAGTWQYNIDWRLPTLVIAAAVACPLLATHWESDIAVASAWRWLATGYLLLLSIPLWFRQHLPGLIRNNASSDVLQTATRRCRGILIAIIVMVYVAMAAYVSQAAFSVAGFDDSALEWLPYVLAWSLLAAILGLGIPRAKSGHRGDVAAHDAPWVRPTSQALLVLSAGPLAVVLAFAVAAALAGQPITGPQPGSWFQRIGWSGSYGIPLAVTALVLIGHAMRERSSRFAFWGGLLLNMVATIVVLLGVGGSGGALDGVAWITVAQVNTIVSAVYALLWMAAIGWYRRQASSPQSADTFAAPWPLLLVTTVALAAVLCGMFILPAAIHLSVEPSPTNWVVKAGDAWGWTALALTAIAAIWGAARHRAVGERIPWLIASLVGMIALTTTQWDKGNWLAYHTLIAGCCLAAWAMPMVGRLARRTTADAATPVVPIRWVFWSVLFSIATVMLGFRALGSDPASPWWTVETLVAISVLLVWIAWQDARRGFVWAAAVLLHFAVSLWWIEDGFALTGSNGLARAAEFLWVNLLTAVLMAVVSVCVERGRILSDRPDARGLGLHRFAAWAIVATLLFTTGFGLYADAFGHSINVFWPLGWAAWLAAAVAAIACWWDPAVRWPIACLYCVGLLGVGMYLDVLNFRDEMFRWALTTALGAYTLATSFLWNRRDTIRTTADRLGVPFAPEAIDMEELPVTARTGSGHSWLVSVNSLLAVVVFVLAVWVVLTADEFGQRMIAAYALGAQALAIGMLSRGAVRSSLQYVSLVFGVLFAMAFGWAWLPPNFDEPWLHRTVIAIVALAAMIAIYGTFLVKLLRRVNEWTMAARQLVPLLATVAGALLLVVLGIEVTDYMNDGEVRIAWPALLAVALAPVGLAALALAAALLPGRDPFGLSERERTVYVYVAEALLVLTFVHIRVTMPWMFKGWFLRFWPLVVMGIAFIGVGLSELFQRRRQTVLSEPLQNTGALLPLLPALGFWTASSEVHYSLLLLSIGVLYAVLSLLRGSYLFGVLAAVAANGSLWYLLHSGEGWGLAAHPQLWLIPPALSVLIGSYLNRDRLTKQQSTSIRYAAAIVIYVSSTADIFINGVAEAPWLPAVLAGLSILGVFAGILLRVRAFLYLGTAFLLVALMTIIWHAAIEQQRTWIMWVAGIVTGVLIIALFGLFEKRRDDVLRIVDQLKHWDT